MKNIKIKTERFVLRTLTVDDATTRYLEWFNGSEIKKNITYASNDISISKLRNYILDKTDSENILMLGIFLKEDFLHIGNIKFEPVDPKRRYAIMGILIGDENWVGKGTGPEVLSACLSWLYREKGIEKVELIANDSNIRAIKAYEKVGFSVQEASYIAPKEGNVTMVFDYE